MIITTVEQLRTLYTPPGERAARRVLSALDSHCRRFIELSPFLVIATSNNAGALDASPRGGSPGFVKVSDDGALLIPDSPGNNKLDSLQNILSHSQVGLIFFIPGVDETLRVNGAAVLSADTPDITRCTDEHRAPKLVVRVTVREAFIHCAKALMRSRLWDPTAQVERSVLPTMGQIVKDHAGLAAPAETQEEMLRRYAPDL